ncbi:MAG: hypothetical protein WA705_30560 [Candidatus Ozemobacteraceae bacterium]
MKSLGYFALCAVVFVFSAFNAAMAEDRVSEPIAGEFVSLAGMDNGDVLLLTVKNQLIHINAKGTVVKTIPLPAIPGADPDARFSDLVVAGTVVTFCRFEEAKLFAFDMDKPDSYKIVQVILPPDSANVPVNFLNISKSGSSFRVLDADNNSYTISPKGEITRKTPNSGLPTTPDGDALLADGPIPVLGLNAWKIKSEAGRILLSLTPPELKKNVISLGILGFDAKNRLIILEISGRTELDNVYTLHAVQDGKIVASKQIPQQGELAVVKSQILFPDGTICLLRGSPDNHGITLHWVSL